MSLHCPNCGVDLVVSDRQGVEIDYCPKCRGVWLDRGELDKILALAEGHLGLSPRTAHTVNTSLFGGARAGPVPRRDHDHSHKPQRDRRRDDDDDDDDDRRKYGHAKRKSWLSDIFD